MCVVANRKYRIPADFFRDVPSQGQKRSEHLSELVCHKYVKDGLTDAWGLNEWVAIEWRVPHGEIWVIDALRPNITVSGSVAFTAGQLFIANSYAKMHNGLYLPKPQWDTVEIAASGTSGGTSTSWNPQLDRQGVDVWYSKFDEDQVIAYKVQNGTGPVNITAWAMGLRYYRTRIYQEALEYLRHRFGDDCEISKLLSSAGCATFVNQRNDADW